MLSGAIRTFGLKLDGLFRLCGLHWVRSAALSDNELPTEQLIRRKRAFRLALHVLFEHYDDIELTNTEGKLKAALRKLYSSSNDDTKFSDLCTSSIAQFADCKDEFPNASDQQDIVSFKEALSSWGPQARPRRDFSYYATSSSLTAPTPFDNAAVYHRDRVSNERLPDAVLESYFELSDSLLSRSSVSYIVDDEIRVRAASLSCPTPTPGNHDGRRTSTSNVGSLESTLTSGQPATSKAISRTFKVPPIKVDERHH